MNVKEYYFIVATLKHIFTSGSKYRLLPVLMFILKEDLGSLLYDWLSKLE